MRILLLSLLALLSVRVLADAPPWGQGGSPSPWGGDVNRSSPYQGSTTEQDSQRIQDAKARERQREEERKKRERAEAAERERQRQIAEEEAERAAAESRRRAQQSADNLLMLIQGIGSAVQTYESARSARRQAQAENTSSDTSTAVSRPVPAPAAPTPATPASAVSTPVRPQTINSGSNTTVYTPGASTPIFRPTPPAPTDLSVITSSPAVPGNSASPTPANKAPIATRPAPAAVPSLPAGLAPNRPAPAAPANTQGGSVAGDCVSDNGQIKCGGPAEPAPTGNNTSPWPQTSAPGVSGGGNHGDIAPQQGQGGNGGNVNGGGSASSGGNGSVGSRVPSSNAGEYEPANQYDGCVRTRSDPNMYNWLAIQNSCSVPVRVAFRTEHGLGASTLAPGANHSIGLTSAEAGQVYLAICRSGFFAVDASGRAWSGYGQYQCRRN